MQGFDVLKLSLLFELLIYVVDSRRKWVPDRGWLAGQWEALLHARSPEDFAWYPVDDPGEEATQQSGRGEAEDRASHP